MNIADLGISGGDWSVIVLIAIGCGTYLVSRLIQLLIEIVRALW